MSGRRAIRLLSAWLGCLAAGGVIGLSLGVGPTARPGAIDRGVAHFVAARRVGLPGLTGFAHAVTRAGDPAAATASVALIGAGLILARRWRVGLLLALSALGGNALANVLKLSFRRDRPELALRLVAATAPSFPSAHATLAGVAATLLSVVALRSGLSPSARATLFTAAWAWGLMVAASRVWLGVHYLSDVATGLVLGSAWAWSAAAIELRRGPAVAKGVATCL